MKYCKYIFHFVYSIVFSTCLSDTCSLSTDWVITCKVFLASWKMVSVAAP